MILAIVLFAVGAVGIESFWRYRGHRPSVADDPAWWAYHRGRASNRNHKTVVLLGASRIQADFCSDTFRSRFPDYELVNLPIGGSSAPATLSDLAADKNFNGIIICSAPNWFLRPGAWENQQEHVEYYQHGWNINTEINCYIRCLLQSQFVALSHACNLQRTLQAILRGEGIPHPFYLATHFDRSHSLDFNLPSGQRVIKNRRSERMRFQSKSNEWNWDDVKRVEDLVQRIKARGGRVAFVTFPISGPRLPFDEQAWPRKRTWDRLVETTDAVTVHYCDVPALANYDCPDMSHLDQRDKKSFTEALLDELVRQNLF